MDKNYRNTDMSIVKTIAWNKGSGNITLRYEGSGTSDITIESDANDLTEEREQTVVISSVEFPSLSVNLLVRQEAGEINVPIYNWEAHSGTWTESSNSSAADGKQFTSSTPDALSFVVMRFSFNNVKKLTFMCKHTVTNNTREYLIVGKLDTKVLLSNYSTSFSGVASGTWKEVAINVPDTNQHYIEFAMYRGFSTSSSCKADVYLLSIE